MFDERTRHGRDVLASVGERYGLEVLDPPVRKSVRFAEAPARGMCIVQHAPRSPGAEAYRAIAATLDEGMARSSGRLSSFGRPRPTLRPAPSGSRA
jgi:chromosome partitioning protein